MAEFRTRLTYANVTSTLCLFMLLGGSAYAAATITGKNIKNSSITGLDVKNKSLTKTDFRGSVRGQQGATGPRGPAGPQGSAGVTSTFDVSGPDVPNGPSGSGREVQSSYAVCPAGSIVTGGGFDGGVRDFVAVAEKSGNGYFVITVNNGSISSSIQAQAICARGPGTGAAAARAAAEPNDRQDRLAEARRQVAEQR